MERELREMLLKLSKRIEKHLAKTERPVRRRDCPFITEDGDCRLTGKCCYFLSSFSTFMMRVPSYWLHCPVYKQAGIVEEEGEKE